MRFRILPAITILLLASNGRLVAQDSMAATGRPALTAHLEYGFLGVLSHKAQFGSDGTYFPYHEEGNQNTLFSVAA